MEVWLTSAQYADTGNDKKDNATTSETQATVSVYFR
jgi:hypothetical protein